MKIELLLCIIPAMLLAINTGCTLPTKAFQADATSDRQQPAIVLVAFGTSPPNARKVFDYIDSRAKEHFPGHDIHWAFTSEIIRRKLKTQGIITQSLTEVVASLRQAGIKRAVFQSLHVAPGQEFNEIKKVDTTGLTIAVGDALLATDADIEAAIKAVETNISPDAPNILVAHGNEHHPEFNVQILKFAQKIEAIHSNTWVCSVEGQPGTEKLQKAAQPAAQKGEVNFIPLMIVAGDHIMNDVMGDEDDSWKNVVAAQKTNCAKPLGYNDEILEIYFQHLENALRKVL
ncbi:MAG: anaerobic cobalt chelatase [Deltaproteobacteria bacterium]|nr:anaerobic cobalt chelatase [Deltaproteobacteria bacterium]